MVVKISDELIIISSSFKCLYRLNCTP
jgi:hypothetical protein